MISTKFEPSTRISRRSAPLCVVVASLVAACGDSGTPPPTNQPPATVGSLADWALTARGSAATVDVAGRFNDPDGDALTYTVRSSDAGVAAASASGSVVTVRPLAAGAATVTVTARDPAGLTAELSAQADVHEPDLAAAVSRDSVALVPGASFEFDIQVRNRGEGRGSAAPTSVAAYVSPDSVIEATDERVGEPREVEALARGGLAWTAAAFAADSATAPWTVVWVGACVEAVEGETETGNNCSRAIKVTTVPAVRWSFVSSDGEESSAGTGDPRTVMKIAIDAPDVDYAGAGWLPLDADDPQAVANVLEMLEVKTVGNEHDSDYDLAAKRWGGTDSCGPICDEQVSIVSTDSQMVVEVRPPGVQSRWKNHYDGIPSLDFLALDPVYQAGDYALSFGVSSRAKLSIDADWRLACGAERDNGVPQYDIVDGDILLWRGTQGDASRDHGRSLGKKADPTKTYVIDVGFVVDKEYWRAGWPEWIPEGVRHSTEIFQRSGVNVELRVPAIVRYQDYKHYIHCQKDSIWRSDTDESSHYLAMTMAEHYGVDLFYKLRQIPKKWGICGGTNPLRLWSSDASARAFYSSGFVDPSCGRENDSLTPRSSSYYMFIVILAHEVGHNLGLDHEPSDYAGPLESKRHPTGYGYRDNIGNATYGTIMATRTSQIPFFSSDRMLPKSEVCNGDARRYDYLFGGIGTCTRYESQLRDTIRLGGAFKAHGKTYHVDAAEAMQYTIEFVSKYYCRPGSCQ